MVELKDVLASVRGQILEEFGENSLGSGEFQGVEEWISTGSPILNRVMGSDQGIPVGRIVEIYGPEGHGKSSLLYYVLGQVQKRGGIAGLIDSEHSYSRGWAEKLGIDTSELLLFQMQPDSSVERFLDVIVATVTRIRERGFEGPVLIGWDTIWCTPTEESLAALQKGESFRNTKRRLGVLARSMSETLPDFHTFLVWNRATVIFVNQVRDNVNVLFGSSDRTPGGRALKHMASVRVAVRRIPGHVAGGIKTKVVNRKNKVSGAFFECELKITGKRGLEIVKSKLTRRKSEAEPGERFEEEEGDE